MDALGEPPALADVVAAVARLYPPSLTEGWDAVGLVCGTPERDVRRILIAVDPVSLVVDEALDIGADLLITHHPLLLRGVHSVAATSAKGRVLTRLIEGGCALHTAHTNADAADPGVSDALAEVLGLVDLRPLQRAPESEPTKMLITYVPADHLDDVLDAAAEAGAGVVGDYTRCAFVSPGNGTYDAPADGSPFIGEAGQRGSAAEVRVEMTLGARLVPAVIAAVRAAHPYEEPAYQVVPVDAAPRTTGIGRVGELVEPMPLAEFAGLVAARLPATHHGVRVAGELGGEVATVAVCGGAGDSLLADATAAGADVYLTADLRHHRVEEHLADGGCAVVDVAHWASEWPWCVQLATLLPGALAELGIAPDSVEVKVSTTSTDPWTQQLPQTGRGDALGQMADEEELA